MSKVSFHIENPLLKLIVEKVIKENNYLNIDIASLSDCSKTVDAEKPDLLILQSDDNENNIIESCKQLKERYKHLLYVIVISNDLDLSLKAKQNKADAFLLYPCSKEEIAISIKRKSTRKNRRILYIDDSRLIHKQIVPQLEEHGYDVLEAYDGQEGIDIALSEHPDLIITDLEMPIKNGYEVTKELKSNSKTENTHLIIITTLGSSYDIQKGFEAGADDYMQKPVVIEELLSRIEMVFKGNELKGRENILLLTDEKNTKNIIKNGLEQQGFNVETTFDINYNFERIIEKKIKTLIIDFDIEDFDGLDYCLRIKKDNQLQELPLIILTSRDNTADKKMLLSIGASTFISKPFSVDKIILSVERFLAEQRLEQQKNALKLYISGAALKAVEDSTIDNLNQLNFAEEKYVTVFYTDVVGFTTKCERKTPFEVTNLLNELFDLMTEVLMKHGAIIDKFIGDAILAFFDHPDRTIGAYKSLKAAKEILSEIDKVNKLRDEKTEIRIGINSGKVVLGNIGSQRYRRDFTIIGDTVNVAARLQGKAPTMNILFGQETYFLVKDMVYTGKTEELELKGKEEKVFAYLLNDIEDILL